MQHIIKSTNIIDRIYLKLISVSRYAATVRVQQQRQDIIQDLSAMVREHLMMFIIIIIIIIR